ncbi:MAG: type II secretion system protein [Chthoniobacteraceae bacterium]
MAGKIIRTPRFGCFAGASAFSLIEVVIALGIFIFALVAIDGLFFVGLNANKSSSEQIQAANVASLLISTRRALPTNAIANFALPPLNVAYPTNAIYVNAVATDGTVGTATSIPAYDLFYQGGTNATTGAHLAQVHLLLSWPPAAAGTGTATPSNNPSTRFEMTTQIALP